MTYQNPQMARGARQLKAVAAVVALIAAALTGLILALAPHEARPEALLVCVGMFAIAIFMWTYAVRPGLFTGDEGVFEDPLRTSYRVPERPGLVSVDEQWHDTARSRAIPVSEHIYAWQGAREVAEGEKIWTPAYVRTVALQAGLAIGGLLACGLTIAGVVLGLGESVGATWFVAAAIILPVGFAMSHGSGVVDAREYPTAPTQPLPDLAWTRAAHAAPGAPAEHAEHADAA